MELFSSILTLPIDSALFSLDVTVSTTGAVLALLFAIGLILLKIHPVYALILGALGGGLAGQAGLTSSVDFMIRGAGGIMSAVLRILGAGILAGVLIRSGAAAKIAAELVRFGGEKLLLPALAFATLILTAVGVFIDIAVITVAPIALAIAGRTGITRTAILVALIGGGKAGNIISPNPNTIVIAENLNIPLTDLMLAGVIPAAAAFLVTCLLAARLKKKGETVDPESVRAENQAEAEVGFGAALSGPIFAIILLALRPMFGIKVDPLIALPAGGIFGLICMRKLRHFNDFSRFGLEKMAPVALLLIGTGCLAGIITNSGVKVSLVELINRLGLSAVTLAPLAGILLGGATASTTAGAAVASASFGKLVIGLGIPPLSVGVMFHSGATVLDSMPHGSFFHATGGSVQMSFGDRLKIIPYEIAIGMTQTLVAFLWFGCFR